MSHVTPQRDHVATVPLLKGVLRYQVPGNKKLSFIHFVPWTNCLWLIGPGRSLIVWLKYQLSIYVLLFQPTQKLDLRKVPWLISGWVSLSKQNVACVWKDCFWLCQIWPLTKKEWFLEPFGFDKCAYTPSMGSLRSTYLNVHSKEHEQQQKIVNNI